eukprot:6486149-Prymnesium_polylepis.2
MASLEGWGHTTKAVVCTAWVACSTHRVLEAWRERERRDLLLLLALERGHNFVGLKASPPKHGRHDDFERRQQCLHRLVQLIGASANVDNERRRMDLQVPGNKAETAGDCLEGR